MSDTKHPLPRTTIASTRPISGVTRSQQTSSTAPRVSVDLSSVPPPATTASALSPKLELRLLSPSHAGSSDGREMKIRALEEAISQKNRLLEEKESLIRSLKEERDKLTETVEQMRAKVRPFLLQNK
jgi:hypothetical protein